MKVSLLSCLELLLIHQEEHLREMNWTEMNSTAKEQCLFLEIIHLKDKSAAVLVTAIVTSAINGMTAIVATIGNSIFIYVFIKVTPLRTPSNILLASLSITDLLVGVIVQPMSIVRRSLEANDIHNCPARVLYAFVGFLCAGASFLNIGLISIDRCLAICLPFWYEATASNRGHVTIVSILWLVWGLFTLLPFVGLLSVDVYFIGVFAVLSINIIIVIISYLLIFKVILAKKRQTAQRGTYGFNNEAYATTNDNLNTPESVRKIDNEIHYDGNSKATVLNSCAVMLNEISARSQCQHDEGPSMINGSVSTPESVRKVDAGNNYDGNLTVPDARGTVQSGVGVQSLLHITNKSKSRINDGMVTPEGIRKIEAGSIIAPESRGTALNDVKQRIRPCKRRREKRKSYTLAILIMCMLICYAPQLTVLLMRGAFGDNVTLVFIADAWVDTITFMNSSINPAIYCFRLTDIRNAVVRVFMRWKRSSDIGASASPVIKREDIGATRS